SPRRGAVIKVHLARLAEWTVFLRVLRRSLARHEVGRLSGQTAIVTGGARGIGRGIVEKFAAEGASVTFLDLDDAAGRGSAGELSARGAPVEFRHADITREHEVQRAIEAVLARHGSLDVLV